MDDDRRIALFLDYENLALGARDHFGEDFDLRPVTEALAERGRVLVRRAYADWSYFDEDRRMLTRSHVELIEMPQRMGAVRKNAADIKMAVDAIEMAFTHDYISTFAICTGDSDFTPLVHKLRELNKNVIGIGVRDSTSKMLPPACDEFLYYDDLAGLDPSARSSSRRRRSTGSGSAAPVPSTGDETDTERAEDPTAQRPAADRARTGQPSVEAHESDRFESGQPEPGQPESEQPESEQDLAVLVAQTVAGLQSSSAADVTASALKRALLRKDPTFTEAAYGFRAFGELINALVDKGVLETAEGPAKGDPVVKLSERGEREEGFSLLRDAILAEGDGAAVPLSGLKDRIRRDRPGFTEKTFGYRSFLQFSRAAETAGVVHLTKTDDGYLVAPQS
ncbi:NYN domain-containing protein [Naumannella halotolerans]|uniref:NYN domain-containing protein n=1 Tax=Naumannella halotolerans TaxID=993414 RepID=UPI00370DBD5F